MMLRIMITAAALAAVVPLLAFGQAAAACGDPMAVVRAFYRANDSRRFDASARYLTDDVKFDTWATGVNGYTMAQRHLKGKKALRAFLADARGLGHRLPDSPADGPIYRETRLSVSGSTVDFMLEPDRKRPNGRAYNPFSIEVVLDGCRIKTLTVIERVTWL